MARSKGKNRRIPSKTTFSTLAVLGWVATRPVIGLAEPSGTPAETPPASATSDAGDSPAALQEVVVTATKRSESLQQVPVSLEALTPAFLAQHFVESSDDYIKLLPSVSFQSFGPGQSQIYFRGITTGNDDSHFGSQPASGIYVDEIPLTTIVNTPDLHVYDLSRVEALSGPQGTLFGASSLSGTLRLITNQPDTTQFSAAYDVKGTDYTGHGTGGTVEGYINIPLSSNVAIRLVAFDEHEGGYISNVAKTRVFQLSPGSDPATGDTLETNSDAYVKRNFNTVDSHGARAALKVDLNDRWTATPAVIYQHQKVEGDFLENPHLGDLNVADFAPDLNVDDWYLATLTIRGKIANWDVLYAGGYFNRTVNNRHDYSYYTVAYDARGSTSYVTFPDGHGGFLDPNQHFTSTDDYTKWSNEFRVSSPIDDRLRFLGGIFSERQSDLGDSNFFVPGLAASGGATVPGAGDDIFLIRLNRIDRDFAVFGELAYDILPGLTMTLGGRYFTTDNTLYGFSGFASDARSPSCVATTSISQVPCVNVNSEAKESGETHKANLAWKIDSQRMIYATYSTGFRPGGANRQATVPKYDPDTVTNYEIGWKTTWLDGRLRFNGAVFDEEWNRLQYAYAPAGSVGVSAIFNAGKARSYGTEWDVGFRATDELTLSISGTALHASLVQTFCSTTDCAPAGTRLPLQPNYKVSASARYGFTIGDLKSFLEGDLSAQGRTTSALFAGDEAILGPNGSFATFDLSTGLGRDNWNVEVFAKNVTDKRGVLSKDTYCAITVCGAYALDYVTKPRQIGVKLSQKF